MGLRLMVSIRARMWRSLLRTATRRAGTPSVEGLRRLQGPPAKPARDMQGLTCHDTRICGADVEVVSPESPRGDVLFLHGGAYVAGTRRSVRPILGQLCREAQVRGWSPDYRLAPEHPFPAGLDDVVAVWKGLLDNGLDPDRTLLGGESAGGGLALAAALALRDAGGPQPSGLLLLWPWTDLTLSGESFVTNERKDFLPTALVREAAASYAEDPTHALVSPLFADLRGLPPVFLQVGDHDLVRDDTTRLASRLAEAGVRHEVHVWPGMPHAWVGAGKLVPEAGRAVAEAARWMDEALRVPS